MADGFELLKAYIALAVKDGDLSKVKGQIEGIKSSLTGLKATSKNALKLDIVGSKGFGGKQAISEIKAQFAELKKVQASLDKINKASNRQLAGASKSLKVLNPDDIKNDLTKAFKKANAQLTVVGEKGFGGKIDISGAKKFQKGLDDRKKEEDKAATAAERAAERIRRANERAAAASERAWRKSAREMNQAFQRVTRFIGNISLEVGFLAPQFQSLGNILRSGFQFANVGFAGGSKLGGGANPFGALFGGIGALTGFIGGTGFAIATKALSVFLGIVGKIGQTLARVAWSTFSSGMSLLFAPTLGLVKAFKLVLQYLPLIVVGLGSKLVQSLSAASIQMERLRNLFGVAFLGKADIQLQRMITLADRMGFSFEDAAEPMAKLTFAAQQAGIELSSVDSLFRGVATAASALRLDNERLSRAFVALEQVISKGRVSSEELRQQLAESIPGIVPIVQRALGLSGQAFDDLLRKGELTAKTLIEALGPELERTFRSGAKANADSLSASVARVRNQFLLLRAELGDRIAPAFVKLQLAMLKFARSNQVFSFLQRMVDGLARMFDLIRTSPLIQEFGRQFLRVFAAIRQDLQDVISKFIRISVVVNGSVLLGLVRIAQGVLPTINRYLDKALSAIQRISGIRINGIEEALSFVAALASQFNRLPEIFDAVSKSIAVRLRVFIDQSIKFIGRAAPIIARLIAEPISASMDLALGNFVRKQRLQRLKALDDISNDPKRNLVERAQANSEIKYIKDLMKKADEEISVRFTKKVVESLNEITEVFNSLEPPGEKLKEDLAAADAASQRVLENFRNAFKVLSLRNLFGNMLLDVFSGASRAVDLVQKTFSRLTASLDGTWAKIAQGIGKASGQFFGAGKQFMRDLQSGQNPFLSLGSAINDAFGSLRDIMKPDTSQLEDSLKSFRAEFFDSDSFFKALQGSDQSSLREQKRTNDKLDEINKNIQEGNRIRAASTGFNSDLRFRGAIA